jgi:hypothetical protein
MSKFTVEAVVVCDDVRKEITSKDILIGAYGGGILVPSLPTVIPIAVWIELTPENAGRLDVDLRLVMPGTTGEFALRIIGDVPRGGEPTSINSPQIMCPIGAAGDIEVSIRSPEEAEWHIVKRKRVTLGSPQQPQMPMGVVVGPPPPIGASPIVSSPPSEQSPPAAPESEKPRARRHPSTRRSGRSPGQE